MARRPNKKSAVREDDIDGCLCGINIDEIDAVDDKDLPAASGGVTIIADAVSGDETATSSADFEIDEAEATPDEQLPAVVGGVVLQPP